MVCIQFFSVASSANHDICVTMISKILKKSQALSLSFLFQMVTHERDMLRKDVKRISSHQLGQGRDREGPATQPQPPPSSSAAVSSAVAQSPASNPTYNTVRHSLQIATPPSDLQLFGYHHHRTSSDTASSPGKGNNKKF